MVRKRVLVRSLTIKMGTKNNNGYAVILVFVFLPLLGGCEREIGTKVPTQPVYYMPKAEDFYAIMIRAESGDGSAELDVALYEMMGRGDMARAKYWLERASKHGEKRADGHLEAMKRKTKTAVPE